MMTAMYTAATAFLHICALLMVVVMVLHIRSKYTAVGRKEIVTFFYLYAAVELLSIFLDSGIIPASSNVYPVGPFAVNRVPCPFAFALFSFSLPEFEQQQLIPNYTATLLSCPSKWFAAVHTGMIAATFWSLLVNGFVGFQFAEDGTPLSLWVSSIFLLKLHPSILILVILPPLSFSPCRTCYFHLSPSRNPRRSNH